MSDNSVKKNVNVVRRTWDVSKYAEAAQAKLEKSLNEEDEVEEKEREKQRRVEVRGELTRARWTEEDSRRRYKYTLTSLLLSSHIYHITCAEASRGRNGLAGVQAGEPRSCWTRRVEEGVLEG